MALQHKGRLVSDRASANECIAVANEIISKALIKSKELSDTAGGSNILNDYVRQALSVLHRAEKLLEQHGSSDR